MAAGDAAGNADSGGAADGASKADSAVADSGAVADASPAPDAGSPADGAVADVASGTDAANAACPQAGLLLDLSKAPGAGAGYAKPKVIGTCDGANFTVTSNCMPHYTFVAMTPNALKENNQKWVIPRNPVVADKVTAIPLLGYAGFTVAGLPIFGPNEAAVPAESAWGDPIYNGLTDGCKGHTADQYHNHALEVKCLSQAGLVAEPWALPDPPADKPSPLLGWAADGFPIYGPIGCLDKACSKVAEMKSGYAKIGDPKKDAWKAYAHTPKPDDPTVLDACNGRTGPDGSYMYHATSGFPYVLGCFRGTPVGVQAGGGGGTDPGTGGNGGPAACTSNSDCTGKCPQGTAGCTCQQTPEGQKCIPTCTSDAQCPKLPNGQQAYCIGGLCKPKM